MRTSTSLLFKNFYEFISVNDLPSIPAKIRGIYALYCEEGKYMNLMYVGMTDAGAKGRLKRHKNSKRKEDRWTHCSIFEVWDNITAEQIKELEALFRHALRLDASASSLNIQKGSTVFRKLKNESKRNLTSNKKIN